MESFALVKDLLTARPQFSYECPPITVYSLRFAILRGNINMFHYLMKRAAHNHDRIHLEPWILLEAAACLNEPSMFSAIARYGFDITQTNESGNGSALAAASASNHMELVRQLYKSGTNVCATAMGFHRTWADYPHNNALDYSLANMDGMSALHAALRNNNKHMVGFLISIGADVNQCYFPAEDTQVEEIHADLPMFPVQLAAQYGDAILVRMLLDAGADPNFACEGITKPFNFNSLWSLISRPALRIALERGDRNMFELLLRCGACMPKLSTGKRWWDPLTSAIRGKDHQLVKFVFQEVGIVDADIHETLAMCIFFCGCALGNELIELASLNPHDIYQPEVLCAAVCQGDGDFVQKLLEDAKACFGELPPGYGATGFARAAELGENDMFSIFLNAGIKPYERPVSMGYSEDQGFATPCPESALVEAIRHSGTRPPTIKQLEQLIDKCELPDPGSDEHDIWKLSMFKACREAVFLHRLDIVTQLVLKGVDVNWAPLEEGTYLQHAAMFGWPDIAEYLLDVGANPGSPAISPPNRWAVHATLQTEAQYSSKLFDRLIRQGADIHAKPALSHGATALQMAAMCGHFENLNVLLKAGAGVNEPPGKHDGRTAIEGAAEHGRLNMVRYLLEAGAEIAGRSNKNYRRTVYRAWKEGHRTVVRLIQEWKKDIYGQDDCESVEFIMASMTYDELFFDSAAAKVEFEDWLTHNEKLGWRSGWERENWTRLSWKRKTYIHSRRSLS
jgi:ankyrin repeat protein